MDGCSLHKNIQILQKRAEEHSLDWAELSILQKDICKVAQIIFPLLGEWNEVLFNLEKQPVWVHRNKNKKTTDYESYNKLIDLQKKVKQSCKECCNGEHPQVRARTIIESEQGNENLQRIVLLMKTDPEEAKENLLSLKFNPSNLELFITLTRYIKNDSHCLNLLFDFLDTHSNGPYSIQLKIFCLESCNWSFLLKERVRYIRDIRFICSQIFNPVYWQCISPFLIPVFVKCPKSTQLGFVPLLKKATQAHDPETCKNAFQTIALLHLEEEFKHEIPPIKEDSSGKGKPVRGNASLGRKELTGIDDHPETQAGLVLPSRRLSQTEQIQWRKQLEGLLSSPNELQVVSAIQAFTRFSSMYPQHYSDCRDILKKYLDSPLAGIRRAAVEFLVRLGCVKYDDIHVCPLLNAIEQEQNAELQVSTLQTILDVFKQYLTLSHFFLNTIRIHERVYDCIKKTQSSNTLHCISLIRTLSTLDGVLQLKEECIQELKEECIQALGKIFINEKKGMDEAYALLCKTDLSSYPEILLAVLKAQKANPLMGTPLTHLLEKHSNDQNNESYLFAIAHKCLAENIELFVQDDRMCLYANNQCHQLIEAGRTTLPMMEIFSCYQTQLLKWKAEEYASKDKYALAGHYYRKINDLDSMMYCYKTGKRTLKTILSEFQQDQELDIHDFSSKYPEFEQCLEATCSLGICYQTGVGLKPIKESEGQKSARNRLEKALRCYMKGNLFKDPLSRYLLATCYKYGLGCKKDEQQAQSLFIGLNQCFSPFPLHIFNLSIHAFLRDKEKSLPPAGTIAVALATLEPSFVDRDKVILLIDKLERPDYEFTCPYVELNESGDLVILIPESVANNTPFIEKLIELGLVGTVVATKRKCGWEQRKMSLKFVVPKAEIESFLRDELHLNDRVYFELMELKKK